MGRAATFAATLLLSALACEREQADKKPAPGLNGKSDEPSDVVPRGDGSLADALENLRRSEAKQYRTANEEEAGAYRNWIGHLAESIVERRLPSQPPLAGFAGTLIDEGQIWLASEGSGRNRGAGALALRAVARTPLVIEAPHTFFDARTLPLALTLFEETGARALLVNTLHRGGTGSKQERAEKVRRGDSKSDVAHDPSSFFQQAHLELTQTWPEDYVVQLHGFRDEKVPSAKIIVSAAGTRARIAPLTRALNDAFGPGTARLYPEEVKLLGGTKNEQARASRADGRSFIHLEIAATLRTRLARQRSLRRQFARALTRGLLVE